MSNNELKKLALLAKQRLKNANYSNKTTNPYTKNNNYFIKNITSMRKLSGNCEFVTLTDAEDIQFIKKVYAMLNNNEDIYNPIGQLIDKEYYEKLNSTEKQFYVLSIAEKYNAAKEKFYQHQMRNNG